MLAPTTIRNLVFHSLLLAGATLALTGCEIQSSKNDGHGDPKKVAIESPMGDLKVTTDNVNAKDTGLSVYPGARPKERDDDDGDKSQAKVNIETPWFGLKVVAVTFLSDDAPDKIWNFYKKDMEKYGRVLECKPGSSDLKLEKTDKDDLVCHDRKGSRRHNRGVSIGMDSEELKVGTDGKQRIVAVKPSGKGTEFSLVYVYTREGKDTI